MIQKSLVSIVLFIVSIFIVYFLFYYHEKVSAPTLNITDKDKIIIDVIALTDNPLDPKYELAGEDPKVVTLYQVLEFYDSPGKYGFPKYKAIKEL
jgi:hypothetical protein